MPHSMGGTPVQTTITPRVIPRNGAREGHDQIQNQDLRETASTELGAGPLFGNAPATSLLSHQPVIQAKLEVGSPDDPLEQEADQMADQVIQRMALDAPPPLPPSTESKPSIQRKCADCEQDEVAQAKFESPPSMIRAKGMAGISTASPEVSSQIHASKGGGNALPPALLTNMQAGFGHDLSQVRLHTDGQAATLSRELNARAFTVGRHIYFGAGQYQPESKAGQHLLAHELTHTLQQSHSTAPSIQRDDKVGLHNSGGLNYQGSLDAKNFTDTSSGGTYSGQNYWAIKLREIYEMGGYSINAGVDTNLLTKDSWDMIFAKAWELKPVATPLSGTNPTVARTTMEAILGAKQGSPGKNHFITCQFQYAFDTNQNKPVLSFTILEIAEATVGRTFAQEVAPGSQNVKKKTYDKLYDATASFFPGKDITHYLNFHLEVREALGSYVQEKLDAHRKQRPKTDLVVTEILRLKERNNTSLNDVLISVKIEDHRAGGDPDSIELKYYGDPQSSVPNNYKGKDRVDALIEKDQREHAGSGEQLAGIEGLDAIADADERAVVRYVAFDIYRSETDKAGVKTRNFRDVEIDQVIPMKDPADPNKVITLYYQFSILPKAVDGGITVKVKRLGKKGEAGTNALDKPSISRIPGYAESAKDAGNADTPDILIKWLKSRYPKVADTEYKAATVSEITTKMDGVIASKSGTPEWFKDNYGIIILNAAMGDQRLKNVNSVSDANRAGMKDYTAAELTWLEMSLERMSLPVLGRMKGINLVRQTAHVPDPTNVSGLTSPFFKFYTKSKKIVPGSLTQTISMYDIAFGNNGILGGEGGINSGNTDTFTHEFGHAISHTNLTGMTTGDDFNKRYDRFVQNMGLKPVTQYARDKAHPGEPLKDAETFAEAFMLFMLDPEFLLRNQHQSYFWMGYLQETGKAPSEGQAKSLSAVWDQVVVKQPGLVKLVTARGMLPLWMEFAKATGKEPSADQIQTLVDILAGFDIDLKRAPRTDEAKAVITSWQSWAKKNKTQPTAADVKGFLPVIMAPQGQQGEGGGK